LEGRVVTNSVLLVDWLGRGGIAQTSEAWRRELVALGADVAIATRGGRELHADVAPPPHAHAVLEHRALAADAARAIEDTRPGLVVVQNYVIPPLERCVYDAARRVGARVIVVVHDDRLHATSAGTHHGLRGLLQRADDVLAHSEYVAARLRARIQRPVTVIDIPVSLGMLDHATAARTDDQRPRRAVHFGVLKRKYKGTDVVTALAGDVPAGWSVDVLGAYGYVASSDLVHALEQSAVTLLPYRMATQSGAVVLAQAMGSVPIATAVGGIPEQIADGRTGVLLPPRPPVACWRRALERLADGDARREMAVAGRIATAAAHRRFVGALEGLVGVRV
jgi:hypothetical protein